MSGGVDAKRAWLERVLGFRLGSASQATGAVLDGAQSADAHDVNGRLLSAGNALRGLREASAPEAAGLNVRFGELVAAAKTDPAAVVGSLDALESDIARAMSAARPREAGPTKGRGVPYRKLLLRWRDAQAIVQNNINAVGTTLLGRPDVQADPRIEEVKKAVAALPNLVPKFGDKLEDVLDAEMNASEPAQMARLAAEATAAIDEYRQQLAAATQLLNLEHFAAKDLRTALPLYSALDQALVELRQQLAA
jgi:hypothetical protein